MKKFKEADRLACLPPYVFAILDQIKETERAKGTSLIDLTIGSPSHLPPADVIEAHIAALKEPQSHKYSSFQGDPNFLAAVSRWCRERYGLDIKSDEIATLVGSKEGLAHFYLAYLNPGEKVLVPLPMYPSHFRAPVLAGGKVVALTAKPENNYLPDLKSIKPAALKKAKILSLSYPTNPTGAVATKEFFTEAVAFAKKHGLILIHDFAYAEIYFDEKQPLSCLSIPGAKEVCVEFHSLSKTFGMAGWRLGFAVGNKQLIASLKSIKTNIDYGAFGATVKAGTAALAHTDGYLASMRAGYQRKRDIIVDGLNSLGWQIKKPAATFYVWFPVPRHGDSLAYVKRLVKETGVMVSPGLGFSGEGYCRIACVDSDERLLEAIDRLKRSGIKFR